MELRRRRDFRKIFTIVYVAAFAVYLAIGLQPADAHEYEISGNLSIPSINLTSDVTALKLENHKLNTPDTIVGSYTKYDSKIFLIGHSSTVFKNLNRVKNNDTIYYNGNIYRITSTETLKKSDVDMTKILSRERENTLIIMTCAGELLDSGDATHRFIVTATEL